LSAAEPPTETVEGLKAKAAANGLHSCVAGGADFEYDVRRLAEASPVGNHTAIPCARTQPEAGVVYLAVVTLGGSPERAPLVSADGRTVRIEWADGQVDHLRLDTA
jgi:hypothetical protein